MKKGNKMKIKVFGICTKSYENIYNDLFLTTMPESLKEDLTVVHLNDIDGIHGNVMSDEFKRITFKKVELIHQWIKSNIGNVIVFCDLDIVFFRDFKEDILNQITNYDMLLHGYDENNYNVGFMAFKCSEKVLKFWSLVVDNFNETKNIYEYDQVATIDLLKKSDIIHGCLPKQYHCNPIWCNPKITNDITDTINAIPNDAFLCHFQAIEQGEGNKYLIMAETIKKFNNDNKN